MNAIEGALKLGDTHLGYTESAVITGGDDVGVTAKEDATLVAFTIDPTAPITRQGTTGR